MTHHLFSRNFYQVVLVLLLAMPQVEAQKNLHVNLVPVDSGWAANSVNAVVFRKNSLVSDAQFQYIAYYNADRHVVLGKRKLGTSKWELKITDFQGNTADAHNAISIMLDGSGFLHLSWDHHNHPLNYSRSLQPGSLEMGPRLSMTGSREEKVTYPEFYRMPSGDLLFMYRDGGSGNGNLVMNMYHTKTKTWKQVQRNLVDGEGKRNAYWQACMDATGSIHLSWVWRETPDVASNHDMCYARSDDGGLTWLKSTGEKYVLPINAANAEYACRIPQGSELINQTSMYAVDKATPCIASYWRTSGDSVPRYQLIIKDKQAWRVVMLPFRKTPFSLSGGGTKAIPISRPQIVTARGSTGLSAVLIFRDIERNNKVSVATTPEIRGNNWSVADLTAEEVGSWEPSYDTELWKRTRLLHIFVQKVQQADGEGKSTLPPQLVQVLEWKPGL